MKNIFVSSTFRDMQAERDLVQERVLPALRDEARKYGDNVGMIDLRWGVDTSALETEEGAAKVLQVCLDEIDRSHPYMLIFIGERYGWIPEGKLIEKAVTGRKDKYVTDDYEKSVTALEIEYGALSEKYGELDHCIVCFRDPVVHMLDGVEKDLYAEHTEEGKRKLETLKERIKRELGEDDRLITYSCTWDKSARQLVDFTTNGQPLETVLTNCFAEMFRDDWKEYENLSWQDKEQLAFRALMESKLRSFVGREELLEKYYEQVMYKKRPFVLRGEAGSGKTAIMCKLAERLQKEGRNVFTFFSRVGNRSNSGESLVKQMVYYLEKQLGLEECCDEDFEEDIDRECVEKENGWLKRLKELCSKIPMGNPVFFVIDGIDLLQQDDYVAQLRFVEVLEDIWNPGWEDDIYSDENDHPHSVVRFENYEEDDKGNLNDIEGDWKILYDIEDDDWEILYDIEDDDWENWSEEERRTNFLLKKLKEKRISIVVSCGLEYETCPRTGSFPDEEELPAILNGGEIKRVLRGILSSFSREMCDTVELEMIGKSRYYTPLYAWLLIQRLNMMDSEDFRYAMDEAAIIEVVTGIIKRFPDELGEAIASLFQSGISKFSEADSGLWDILNYLAVSRNGLRLQDLQGVFQKKRKVFNMLDFVNLIKYLDAFFLLGTDSKIEYANKAIRQGLLENILDKESYEIDIKDYIKTLDREDDLFLQEGMYYARITEDFELAENLFVVANKGKKEFLVDVILREVAEDVDDFFCKMVLREVTETSLIRDFFLQNGILKPHKLGEKAERLVEILLQKCEEVHNKYQSEKSLKQLHDGYWVMANNKRTEEAVEFLEKRLRCAIQLHSLQKSEQSILLVGTSYFDLSVLLLGVSYKQHMEYYEKMLDCGVCRLKNGRNYELKYKPNRVATEYIRLAHQVAPLRKEQDCYRYYEKALKWKEKYGDIKNVVAAYEKAGELFMRFSWVDKAVIVYGKSIRYIEGQFDRMDNEDRLIELSKSYFNMGNALKGLCQERKALVYYERSLQFKELLYKERANESRLYDLLSVYNNMGNILCDLDRFEEALIYYDKILKGREELYRLDLSDANLSSLSAAYNNFGRTLCEFGKSEEAVEYLEKALQYTEELHQKNPTKNTQLSLVVRWRNLTKALLGTHCLTEALVYGKKAVELDRELYSQDDSDKAKERVVKSLSIYAETLFADNQINDAYEVYTEALEHCKSVCEKNDSIPNVRIYVKVLKGLYLCLNKIERSAEAEEYLFLAKEQAKKLYERSRTEKDKKLLDELGY